MNGIEAVVSALKDNDVRVVTGVPGFPITDLFENIIDIKKEWSVNEKVALDIALGSSVCGERSAVITKHVGMNILADPLVSSTTHTIGAGVVILAGDDPGVQKSQNEQDSRFYGLVAEVPVFDPASPEKAYMSVAEAFRISEKASVPVVVRITDRLLNMKGNVERNNESIVALSLNKKMWGLTMVGKHQRFHKTSYPVMCEYAESSPLNTLNIKGKIGIISSGFPSYLVDPILPENVSHLSLGVVNPLPVDLVERFLNEHERVLVVEETEPVIERQLSKRILGKLTGHIPYGIVETRDIREALNNIDEDRVEREIIPQTIKGRGARQLCDDCPYIPLYEAIKELNVPVAGDLGCSILTSAPPMSLIDAAYSLGSAISTASGFNKKGIALIGDFGLVHSGINGLINAVHNKHDVVVVVLQNDVSAMTGGQSVPDLTALVRSYIDDTGTIYLEDFNGIKELLRSKIEKKGISVIVAHGKCPGY